MSINALLGTLEPVGEMPLWLGTVIAVTTGSVSVRLDGSDTAVTAKGTASVADRVIVTKIGRTLYILTSGAGGSGSGRGTAFYEDSGFATVAGACDIVCTYLPLDHSEHVYWGGTYQPGSEWVRPSYVITLTEPKIQPGDECTVEYAYDVTGSVLGPAITSPIEGTTTTDNTPTISGTGAAGRSLQAFIDGVSIGTTTIAPDGTWSLTSASIAVGPHVATATQTNADLTTIDALPVDFSVVSPSPATITYRGSHVGVYGTSTAPATWSLPAGTVIGDLIAVMTNAPVTDTRLTSVGGGLWVGWASTLADVAVTLPGAPSGRWSIACITLLTNAVAWTSAVVQVTAQAIGSTVPIPQISGVAVTICGINDGHNIVNGQTTQPTGYTTSASSPVAKVHSRCDTWSTGSLSTSPAGPSGFSGGDGHATVSVIGLIGP